MKNCASIKKVSLFWTFLSIFLYISHIFHVWQSRHQFWDSCNIISEFHNRVILNCVPATTTLSTKLHRLSSAKFSKDFILLRTRRKEKIVIDRTLFVTFSISVNLFIIFYKFKYIKITSFIYFSYIFSFTVIVLFLWLNTLIEHVVRLRIPESSRCRRAEKWPN